VVSGYLYLGDKIAKYFAMTGFCDLFSQLASIPEFHQRWRGFAKTANIKHCLVLLVSYIFGIFRRFVTYLVKNY
jgi:hypothetical protein